MSETQYYVEYSKSNRAKCSYGKQCNDLISKGELRLATHFEAGDVPMTKYRHWRCITRTIINHINQSTGGDLSGISSLNADDQALVRDTLERGYYEGGTEDANLANKAAAKAAKDAEKDRAKAEKAAAKAAEKAAKDAEKERIKAEKAAARTAKSSATRSKVSAKKAQEDIDEVDQAVTPAAVTPVKRNRRGAAIKKQAPVHESDDDEGADGLSSEEEDHEDNYSDKDASDGSDDEHDEDEDESDHDDEKPSTKRRKTAAQPKKPAVVGSRQSKRVAAARK